MTLSALPSAPPIVAIIGRPNVGKSALLNCLARQRISIVEPTSGVTRDRVSALIEHEGRLLEVWDTGGIGSPDDLAAEVTVQIDVAIRRADLILFVVDVQAGLGPMDVHVAERLRPLKTPILLVANKADHPRHEDRLGEFYKLGLGDPIPVSALHGLGRSDLLERVLERTPVVTARPADPELRLAVVGRQNVGKSTLINTLAREERVIVSEKPGTTRDSIDVRFEMDGRVFVAIDTAGVKRRARLKGSVEFYSFTRTDAAIRRADVVLFMIDATDEIARMDLRIGHRIEELGKPCAIVVNKWDLAANVTPDQYVRYLNAHLHMLDYAPVSFLSAREGTHVRETIDLARDLFRQTRFQVSTSQLNELLAEAQAVRRPESQGNRSARIYYGTQVSSSPPTFLLFAGHPQLITENYTRFLANFLRKRLECHELPLRIVWRSHRREGEPAEGEKRDRHAFKRPKASQSPFPHAGRKKP